MKKDVLIVDAYNMIGNWPDLNRLKQANRMEDARDQLLATLSEYRKYLKTTIIVVFDAMYVPGISQKYDHYGLQVVWTGQDETADEYIESLTKEKQTRFTQVTVATSDQAEQWTIFSEGALRIPAGELLTDINRTRKEVHTQAVKYADLGQVRRSPWSQEQLLKLEKLRDHLGDDDQPGK